MDNSGTWWWGGAASPPVRLVADEDLSMKMMPSSTGADVEGGAAESKQEEKCATVETSTAALAVAATAAVELTNIFFFLHGDTERALATRRRCCELGLVCVARIIEAVTVILAFAAFLSAAGLLLLRSPALGRHDIVSAACVRAVLLASTAALFLASVGTVFSLLHDDRGVLP
ncbi:hypothetical protein GUJ93_ZPchr0006g46290 [Zizania palustris]|uniref:Uncharacterized protein n=1 Tax=Zizania palustris TaxID=103762 RepID=A0A8J5VJA2_ZIZPA|nr:hypothetical protein GUJ93_ZPchr0006g46290 [Zizania palustris]